MTKTNREIESLAFTSVDDLRVQIKYSKMTGKTLEQDTLKKAHELCMQHGYKTKAKMINALIKTK
jgi:hypothetical protein